MLKPLKPAFLIHFINIKYNSRAPQLEYRTRRIGYWLITLFSIPKAPFT